ncbi:MAG: 2-amino-4-hydroxy-6-hydroxymethyldihydropteridine diphosphokinase [Synechococcales cyanobacterium T60_A2020_003]|nr:2-amino-4-hydroxy-6-hydroxymethyldihydropteridine diphosphokinase [Synechococcales cyanobacterium T60_A2020_003]
MTDVAIALGSNLGDSRTILAQALTQLHECPSITVVRTSSLYKTAPVGPPQPDYLNACAILDTHLEPLELLHILQRVEQSFGRVRDKRWGPRTLDLDLLLFSDRILITDELEIPHPRMGDRAFVLVPLAEIAGHWIDPVSQRAIADLVRHVDPDGVRRLDDA